MNPVMRNKKYVRFAEILYNKEFLNQGRENLV